MCVGLCVCKEYFVRVGEWVRVHAYGGYIVMAVSIIIIALGPPARIPDSYKVYRINKTVRATARTCMNPTEVP